MKEMLLGVWKNKKKRTIAIVALILVLSLICGCIYYACWNSQPTAKEDTKTTDETVEVDDKKQEEESITGISKLDANTLVEQEETVYATTQVNVRVAPDKNAEVFKVAEVKEVFTREAYDDTWSLVVIEETSYFIVSEYLTTDLEALEQQIKEKEEVAKSQAMSGAAGTGICYNMSASHIVAIDAGHQARGNSETEPNAPGSSTMKAKVTGGTTGTTTGLTEYQLNLNVALKLRDVLLSRGYGVVMIRETNDVNISNVERAQIAQNAGADILVRIHANGANDSSVNGIMTICMTSGNPYNGNLYSASRSLSDKILANASLATGARAQSVWETDTMTGINWATMPVSIIEMGYMTNPTEDSNLATDGYQQNMASGIANGIDQYFQ